MVHSINIFVSTALIRTGQIDWLAKWEPTTGFKGKLNQLKLRHTTSGRASIPRFHLLFVVVQVQVYSADQEARVEASPVKSQTTKTKRGRRRTGYSCSSVRLNLLLWFGGSHGNITNLCHHQGAKLDQSGGSAECLLPNNLTLKKASLGPMSLIWGILKALHLWKKPDYRAMESHEAKQRFHTKDWQMSWRKTDNIRKKEDTPSFNGENVPKCGYFTFVTLLVETQHHNEALCSSEWSESWQSSKPENHHEHFTVLNDGLLNESNKQDKDTNERSRSEECWRLVNHYGCNKSKLPQIQKSHSPEWSNAWKN